MKSFTICFFLLTWFSQILIAQVGNKSSYSDIFISIGYINSNPSDIRNIYNDILGYYQYYGIPIHNQTDFGKTLSFGAGIIASRVAKLQAGVELSYYFSSAYAGYKDYAGTLNVDGSIKSYQASLLLQYILFQKKYFSFFVRLEPGWAYTTFIINEKLNYTEMPQFNYNYTLKAHGGNPCAEATCGISIPVSHFLFSFIIGYRYFNISNPEGSWQPDEAESSWRGNRYFSQDIDGTKKLKSDINQSGMIYSFSLGFEL